MKLRIFPEIIEDFPGLHLGVVVARGIENQGDSSEIGELIRKRQDKIRDQFTLDKLPEFPRIQSWRKAYASFGAKPKKYRSSVESLLGPWNLMRCRQHVRGEVLCRRWNWRECEKTKMTEQTRDVLLVSEGLPPVSAQNMICSF